MSSTRNTNAQSTVIRQRIIAFLSAQRDQNQYPSKTELQRALSLTRAQLHYHLTALAEKNLVGFRTATRMVEADVIEVYLVPQHPKHANA